VITETTTSTTTTTTTTSTIPVPTVARFVFSPLTPQALQRVNFDASSSTPGTGRVIVDYSWDFGDGDPKKNGVMVTHDFAISGVYLTTLTVTDSAGEKVTNAQTITVRPVVP
jgi:PKD repeat protein